MRYGDYVILPKRLARKGASAAYMYGGKHALLMHCAAYGTQGRVKVTLLKKGTIKVTTHA